MYWCDLGKNILCWWKSSESINWNKNNVIFICKWRLVCIYGYFFLWVVWVKCNLNWRGIKIFVWKYVCVYYDVLRWNVWYWIFKYSWV